MAPPMIAIRNDTVLQRVDPSETVVIRQPIGQGARNDTVVERVRQETEIQKVSGGSGAYESDGSVSESEMYAARAFKPKP